MKKDSSVLPRISVVTPCLNQKRFLEATIRSVVEQDYPALDYIVMDGGSRDGSVETIRRYEGKITYWVSEPDAGHYDAVNKGMAQATGDILCWLNSDDLLAPQALSVVAEIFETFPDVQWITGFPAWWDGDGRLIAVAERVPVYGRAYLRRGEHDSRNLPGVQQESCFWRRSLWEKIGRRIDTRWDLAGDFDLWARMAEHADLVTVCTVLAGNRLHPDQRSARQKDEYFRQVEQIAALRGARPWTRSNLLGRLRRLRGGYAISRWLMRDRGTVLEWEGAPDYRWTQVTRRVLPTA